MTTNDLSIRSLRRPYQMMVLATLIAAALVGLLLIPFAKADAQEATADEASFSFVGVTPNTGTRTAGEHVDLYFQESHNHGDLTLSSCTVNGVQQTNLLNLSGGLYQIVYTVGANDEERNAGAIPVNCTFMTSSGSTLTASSWTDNNMLAIDTNNNGQISSSAAVTPAFSSVGVVPTSGTLTTGNTLEVFFNEQNHMGDLSVVGQCKVNGVNIGAVQNLTGGMYKGVYTIGANDTPRAAGQIPVDCTLGNAAGSAHATAWTDNNSVAIAFSGNTTTGTTTPIVVPAPGADGIATYFSPNSGTLTNGQTLELHMEVGLDANDTNPVISPACSINGVDVTNSYSNLTSGTNGHFKFAYTVGPNDTDRSAGQIPLNCTLHQTGTVTVTNFDDNNTVAIDATATTTGNGNGTGTTTAPALASFSVTPSSGMIEQGESAEILITAASSTSDLAVAGTCKVNLVDVSSSFVNLHNGTYKLTYTVGANDGERPAGYLPIDCTLGNSRGTILIHHPWYDGNTLAIDVNGDNQIDNGTNTLGFTVSASPSSGTLAAGQSFNILIQDPLPSGDVVISQNGCTVNGVDVSGSYTYLGNGLYRVSYMASTTDTQRTAGQIPVNCNLQNHTGEVHLTSFTDSNTLAIAFQSAGGSTGGNHTSTTTPGTINGQVTGGVEADNGVLALTSVDQIQSTAVANGDFADGWKWVFHITVPTNETSLQLRFADWANATSASSTIGTANNMRISSSQSTTGATIITNADTYSDSLTLNGDLDTNTPGRQIEVLVEMRVPSGSVNGSYSTSYGIRSF